MDASAFAPDASFLLLALCVALAYTVEAATGFGSVLIALTLGAQLYPIAELLPLLLPLSLLLTGSMALRHRRHVDGRLLLRGVLPRMGAGLVLGFGAFAFAPSELLAPALGVFVLVVAASELWRARVARAGVEARPLGRAAFTGVTLGAGVMQGAMASGGPVLVYALGRLGLPKARFRATLATVWLTLNTLLVVSYVSTGRLGAHELPYLAVLAPVVTVAIGAGEWLHARMDEAAFRKAVLVLLAGAGVALFV